MTTRSCKQKPNAAQPQVKFTNFKSISSRSKWRFPIFSSSFVYFFQCWTFLGHQFFDAICRANQLNWVQWWMNAPYLRHCSDELFPRAPAPARRRQLFCRNQNDWNWPFHPGPIQSYQNNASITAGPITFKVQQLAIIPNNNKRAIGDIQCLWFVPFKSELRCNSFLESCQDECKW